MPSERGLAWSGSPQAFHFIGGNKSQTCVTVLHMLSISNAAVERDRILAAAASCVVDFGVERVTLAEIARRAGVSRPTVYRRWPDTRSVLAALLTRHITAALSEVPARGSGREALVDRVVTVAERLRSDDLVMAVLRSELALVYIAQRLGSSQQMLIGALAAICEPASATAACGPAIRANWPRWCC